MSAKLPIFDYATLPENERAFVERTLGSFTMLSQVLDWGMELEPPVTVTDIVTQDEYTHDILLRLADGKYLNLDCT